MGEKDRKGELRKMARVIGGSVFSSDINEMTRDFMAVRALKPNLKNYVINESLRIKDTDILHPQQWVEAADMWAKSMGVDTYTVVQHSESEIHLAALRIRTDGSVVNDSQDWRRSEQTIRQIEQEFGLQKLEVSHLLDPDKIEEAIPTRGELAMFERTKEVPPKLVIADRIDEVIKRHGGKITATDFISELQKHGIEPIANVAKTGKMSGFSFQYNGIKFGGEKVATKYKWSNLKGSVEYDYGRDFVACASTKIGTRFADDIRDELRARENNERTPEDIERISADIKSQEKFDDAKRGAKSAERRAIKNNKSIEYSNKNEFSRGWWTSSDARRFVVRDTIENQVNAMPCDRYSIRILRMDSDEPLQTRDFTRDQLLSDKVIGWLSYQNIEHEILMRPIDRHYFMLDNVSVEAVDFLKDKGFKPCLVTEASERNCQSWYNLRDYTFDSITVIEIIMVIIAAIMRLFGIHLETGGFSADKGSMTKDRYGKLGGFTNHKPSREYIDEYGRVLAPFVKVVESKGDAINGENAKNLVDYGLEVWHAKHDDDAIKNTKAATFLSRVKLEPIESFFARKLAANDKPDESSRDFSVAMAALYAGYHPDDVKAVLEEQRQDKKNPNYYAEHTVESALEKMGRHVKAAAVGVDDKPQQ